MRPLYITRIVSKSMLFSSEPSKIPICLHDESFISQLFYFTPLRTIKILMDHESWSNMTPTDRPYGWRYYALNCTHLLYSSFLLLYSIDSISSGCEGVLLWLHAINSYLIYRNVTISDHSRRLRRPLRCHSLLQCLINHVLWCISETLRHAAFLFWHSRLTNPLVKELSLWINLHLPRSQTCSKFDGKYTLYFNNQH